MNNNNAGAFAWYSSCSFSVFTCCLLYLCIASLYSLELSFYSTCRPLTSASLHSLCPSFLLHAPSPCVMLCSRIRVILPDLSVPRRLAFGSSVVKYGCSNTSLAVGRARRGQRQTWRSKMLLVIHVLGTSRQKVEGTLCADKARTKPDLFWPVRRDGVPENSHLVELIDSPPSPGEMACLVKISTKTQAADQTTCWSMLHLPSNLTQRRANAGDDSVGVVFAFVSRSYCRTVQDQVNLQPTIAKHKDVVL